MTAPQRNTSRGYYSPNAKIQEGYYRGPTNVFYLKSVLVDAVSIVNSSRIINRVKAIAALSAGRASVSKAIVKFKSALVNLIQLAKVNKRFARSRSIAANLVGLPYFNARHSLIRRFIALSTNIAFSIRGVNKKKAAAAIGVGIAKSAKSINRFKKAIVDLVQIVLNRKNINRNRKVYAISVSLAKFKQFKPLLRSISAISSSIINITRAKRSRRNVAVLEVNSAVITRHKNYGRIATVTSVYRIGTSKRIFKIRNIVVTAVGFARYYATRPFYLFVKEPYITPNYTIQSASYTITNNVDIIGDVGVENDLHPEDYAETETTVADGYSTDENTLPVDYNEPDYPSGEDVVPT